MNLKSYKLEADRELLLFEFFSEGPRGRIKKVVQYAESNLKNFYNLGFGDEHPATKEIDDLSVTNNGDSQQVLTTVAASLYAFTERYPDAWVYATGSTGGRTRLYRMGIANNLTDIRADFDVYGLLNDDWHPFAPGNDYAAFLVRRKKARSHDAPTLE